MKRPNSPHIITRQGTQTTETSWDDVGDFLEERLLRRSDGRSSLERLVGNGVDRKHLIEGLVFASGALRVQQSIRRQSARSKSGFGAPPGMTWKQFLGRIKRYEEVADEIERLNAYPLYKPEHWFPLVNPDEEFGRRDLAASLGRTRVKNGFADLPGLLRTYAHFLKQASASIHATPHDIRENAPFNASKVTGALATYVKTVARGQKSLDDLVILLDATYEIFGVKPGRRHSDIGTNPNTLRRQIDRGKNRRTVQR